MNKNLKKVISAVAALALSASSFVALAATYPDVDLSASYKQAVDELSAMNVINGYEDGTFQPDGLVTRAEFTKMVVTALGSSVLSQAEAATGTDTQFTDVTGDHWAAGYITAAVTNSIINGMGDGTFAPESNVTYAQAMKMLVCSAGYEQWSVDQGGWPDGYMYWANQVKIGNGVTDVTNDTNVTRAQVAQMIDNTLTAPVCVNTNDYDYNVLTGEKYPKLEAKDGYGIDYQNILIKNHDIYKVKGIVTATSRSDSGVKSDEVNFTVQNARNWLDQEEQITKAKGNSESITAKISDSGIENYLRQYVEVLIQDDDDEYTILSVAVAGQSDEVSRAADDFDYENSNYTDGDYVSAGKLYFYTSGKTTSYKIDENVELYVNGVPYDDVNEGIDLYVVDNTTSDVTLVDTPSDDSNSTDGYYDLIMVDYYGTLVVDSVDEADTDEPTINSLADDMELGSWDLDLSDDDITYEFTKDGSEISVEDIAQYDVLSIKYNVVDGFDDSNFYEVVVSSTVDEGKYTLYNSEDEEYTINGTVYKYNTSTVSALEQGVTYAFYIDAFGTIAYIDEDNASGSTKKIAILDSVYSVYGGESYEAKLVFTDGITGTYVLRETGTNIADALDIVYVDGDSDNGKNDIQDRVVEYTINSSSELTIKKGTNLSYASFEDAEYKEVSSRIGSTRISEDTTALVNASDITDITAMAMSTLVDGSEYTGYAYDKSSSSSVYRFVIILNGAGDITTSTNMAIYNKLLSTENDLGDAVDAYDLFVKGENVTVNWESGLDADSLSLGAPILYATNASGEITETVSLASIDFTDTDTVWDAALEDSEAIIEDAKTYVQSLSGKYDADLYFGAITYKSSTSLDITPIVDGVSNLDDAENISYASDVNFYTIDFNNKSSERLSVVSSSSVVATSVSNNAYDDDKINITWENNGKNNRYPRLALVKTYDGDATDVYIIIPKKN